MSRSSAYLSFQTGKKTLKVVFTGVTSVSHTLALNLDNLSAQGSDLVNGARNLPDQVALQVLETDAEQGPGGAAALLGTLSRMKRSRSLCRMVTSMGTYKDMLLTEINATQDEQSPDGWSGELFFTQYLPETEETAGTVKQNDNSSTRTNTGTGAGHKVTDTGLWQLLQRAGVME